MSDTRQVKQQAVVAATPELAFEALTRASELREWLSSGAWTDLRPGGRYGLHWDGAYHVEGKFVEVDPPHRAVVMWHGTGEPGETRVELSVVPVTGGAEVTVLHTGFGAGAEWDGAVEHAEKGWATGLENLLSTLETGVDLRIARRPFLGIYPEQLDAERALREGIAVQQGIYLHGALEGTGAHAAGLGSGDVIVSFDGRPTATFAEFEDAVGRRRAGDVIALEVVHGQERRAVQLTLGQRPHRELPASAEALSGLVADQYRETDPELKAAVEGLTEEVAERCPAEGEWSAKQVLAHLILAERDLQQFLAVAALAGWQDGGDGNPGAIPGRLAAVLAITPSLLGLVDCLLAAEAETVAFVRGLPAETLAHKARLFRITQYLGFLSFHIHDHVDQIRRAVGRQ